MARLLLFFCIVLPSFTVLRAEIGCSIPAQTKAAANANRLIHQLRQIKVAGFDDSFPAQSAPLTQQLKQALAETAISVLACSSATATPQSLQTRLATLLHANLPQPKDNTVPENDDPNKPVENVLATNLKVRVSRASDSPQLLAVQFTFDISCGDDNVLLVFQSSNQHWKPVLLWQAQNVNDIGKAFGDFFLWKILPGASPQQWRLVAAHGKPWCTSRFSGFSIDVLAPAAEPSHPRLIWHADRGYSRSDFTPTLKTDANTFDLRVNDDAMHFDMDLAFERRVIYRYRVTGDHIERIQPVALNARGFVEEWLSAPWPEAANFTADPGNAFIQSIHHDFERQQGETGNTFTSSAYGPVFACKPGRDVQVEMKATRETIVANKPPASVPLSSTFYHLHDTGNGYTLVSIGHQPDPQCTGPNLLHDEQ